MQDAPSSSAPALQSPAPPSPFSDAELRRRRLLVARAQASAGSPDHLAQVARVEAAERLQAAREAAERATLARERPRPSLTNEFDPGAPKPKWAREGRGGGGGFVRGRRKLRPWKRRQKPGAEPSGAVLAFSREHAWTPERSQALAVRCKKNSAIIAHPRTAAAALQQLGLWTQAAIRRVLHGQGWTLGDECARRHIALWATLEGFARPRAFLRPRRVRSSSGASRFAGVARYGFAVVGWTQPALALTVSGPATIDAGADPVDVKTVQRHTELAIEYGALQRVVRNPAAEPELRGNPTDSNPRGWPINEYWIPAPHFGKPGFSGRWFDDDGNPLELEPSLALPLEPRAKRPRRLRELRAQQAPPPTVA